MSSENYLLGAEKSREIVPFVHGEGLAIDKSDDSTRLGMMKNCTY